ncbi:hypothetical protein ACQ7B2_29950, partial [Escherichia coli]
PEGLNGAADAVDRLEGGDGDASEVGKERQPFHELLRDEALPDGFRGQPRSDPLRPAAAAHSDGQQTVSR